MKKYTCEICGCEGHNIIDFARATMDKTKRKRTLCHSCAWNLEEKEE